MKWKLLYPRVFGWRMKEISGAITRFSISKNKVYECYIEHDIIKNCTPEMIEWWFRNIGGEMEYKGVKYQRYHVWHPIDHIHWELAKKDKNGEAGVGAKFRIVEAFNGNEKWLIDVTEEVKKLNKTGIILENRVMGVRVSKLEHKFVKAENGTRYVSKLEVGVDSLIGRLIINPLMHRFIFTKEMGPAWIKHNIEEVGNFEFFLPELYFKENGKKIISPSIF